jgi:hypothetical protein
MALRVAPATVSPKACVRHPKDAATSASALAAKACVPRAWRFTMAVACGDCLGVAQGSVASPKLARVTLRFTPAQTTAMSQSTMCAARTDSPPCATQRPRGAPVAGAGVGHLGALLDEVRREEALMRLVFMEVARRQHGCEDRHVGVELHPHQSVDHRRGHELVPVDAAVDDQPAGDDRVIPAAAREACACSGISKAPGTSNSSIRSGASRRSNSALCRGDGAV